MRLKAEIKEHFKESIKKISPEARIFLFGSRTHDKAKGGDIDILILSNKKLKFRELSTIRTEFYSYFGYQKIDLVNFTYGENHPFKALILKNAVEL